MKMHKSAEVYVKNYKIGDYHLGKLVMDCFLQRDKDAICQIDAWTGETEAFGSQHLRSVKLARCLRRLGLQPGDVLAFGGRNHLDVYIPFYAAMFNGLPAMGVDPFYKHDEIKKLFKLTRPKIAFCQQDMLETYRQVSQELGLDIKIFTYDGDNSLDSLIDSCDEGVDGFECANFDQDRIYCWLITTSGTTGGLKVAAFKHKEIVSEFMTYVQIFNPSKNTKINLNISPVQWLTSYINAISMPLMNITKLMTSGPYDSVDHVIDVINKYRPEKLAASPSLMSLIVNSEKQCDLSCFIAVYMTGSKIYKELIYEFKRRINPKGVVIEMYGQTETLGAVLYPTHNIVGSCGKPWPKRQIKLVNPNTGEEITEPNKPGEMYTKGPSFTEYLNDPISTAEAFTEDGWYKTGDLLYRDEDNNYFFVDRIKMLIKYQGNTIMPPELEEVIMSLEGVQEVAVTSVPDPLDCERPVACVVIKPGCKITAEQVKQHVASKLSTKKQLHGGVVFMDELPKTSSGKVHRYRVKQMVLNAERL